MAGFHSAGLNLIVGFDTSIGKQKMNIYYAKLWKTTLELQSICSNILCYIRYSSAPR